MLGVFLCALHALMRDAPPLLAAAVLLAAWVGLTGALHLDGLADSADAWVGGMGDRKRTLAIMKDPASGPIAVSVVVLVLLLKFSALASLPRHGWPLLLVAPVIARGLLVLACIGMPYARAAGMADGLGQAPRVIAIVSLLVVLAWVAVCGTTAWIGLGLALAVFVAWRVACLRRLGGYTGDTLGALVELAETAVLLALLFAMG